MRRRVLQSATVRWSPRRLKLLLLSGTAMAVATVVVLVWTVVQVLLHSSSSEDDSAEATGQSELQVEVEAGLTAAQPGELTTTEPGRIRLPKATELGAGGVPAGFPRTPAGALAQLAAIDQTALASVSLPDAQKIAETWIAPGGPSPDEWSVVSALQELLTTSGQPGTGASLRLQAEPAMGAFRDEGGLSGTAPDEADLVACVDFVVSLTTSDTDQIAAADCQRMTWDGSRWVIASGPEEMAPSSYWPGSPESVEAGWRWLVVSR